MTPFRDACDPASYAADLPPLKAPRLQDGIRAGLRALPCTRYNFLRAITDDQASLAHRTAENILYKLRKHGCIVNHGGTAALKRTPLGTSFLLTLDALPE